MGRWALNQDCLARVLCLRQQPDEDPLNLKHEEQSQTAQKHQEKAHAQTNNLTRFGLNAYVLGAIKREVFTLKD